MFKNMKIGKKLIVSFIIVALIASIAGITSIFIIKTIDTKYSKALVQEGFVLGDVGKAMLMVANDSSAVADIVGFTDQTIIQQKIAERTEYENKYTGYLAAVEKQIHSDEGIALMETVAEKLDAYYAKADEVIALGNTTDAELSAQAQAKMSSELYPIYDELYKAWTDVMQLKETQGTEVSASLTSQGIVFMAISVGLVIIALIAAVIFGLYISKGIARPIELCVGRLKLLSEGNLAEPVPEINTGDETKMLADATQVIVSALQEVIGDTRDLLEQIANNNFDIRTKHPEVYIGDFAPLLVSMRSITENLSETMEQVIQSSEQVLAASEQMASGAQDLAEGATEQAGAVEELLATVSDVTSNVEDSAKEAMNTSKKAQSIGEEAKISNKRMETMTEAMKRINDASKKIADIIQTIEDIASQTNLLSLNASIEAARAGEAGRGFSVVAGEIGQLASQSATAVEDTRELIETALREVGNGDTIVAQTAESMNAMVTGIEGIVHEIEAVADSSEQQAASMRQVNDGIEQISSVVQTNSATAEESSATSEELSAQANTLNGLVSIFTLRKEH
ncbi:MAG: methyl-accepting chemotaxis protein [Lachnospiraceae bacterium]